MKGVIISLCIAAVIVAGSAAYTAHTKTVSRELGEINAGVMESLQNNDFDGAKEKIEQLTGYMERKRSILSATGNHEELDKMEMNISEMTGYTEGHQQTDAVSRCKVLAFLFEHFPKNYELKLGNIL
ncbi:MAG: DUF4363 family protein [Oscillospiraceae bacterium]|nr:DUF4363 family protein [Oscillospiraceae bacterium]